MLFRSSRRVSRLLRTQNSYTPELRLLRLAAKECRHVQIVRRNFLADFADILLDLVDHIRRLLRHRRLGDFPPGLPSLWKERLLLRYVFPVGVLEPGGDNGDLDGVLHVVILHSAENDVRILVRGLLNDARGFVDFMQTKAGATRDIDENALRALNGIVFNISGSSSLSLHEVHEASSVIQ